MYLAADCMHSITELLGKEYKLSKVSTRWKEKEASLLSFYSHITDVEKQILQEDYNSTAKLLSNFNLLNQVYSLSQRFSHFH